MQEINLLQNRVKDTTNSWQRQSKLVIVLLSLILLVLIVGGGGLFFANRSLESQALDLTTQNQDLQTSLTAQEQSLKNAKAFQAQLVNIHTLLDNHVYVSPLLDELSKYTYLKAQYDTINVAETGKIHLEGKTSTYNDLGKLLLGLSTAPQLKNVELLAVRPSTGKINAFEFSIDMNASPDIFYKKQ